MNPDSRSVDISVVVPVYDELTNLRPLVEELDRTLSARPVQVEIILVDDGSRDGSSALIDELAQSHAHVRGLHFRRNRGQTAAFDAGFKAATGQAVVTIDADLQNDPADIFTLLDALEECDAAVGYRRKREDSLLRRWSSKIANAIRNRLSGDDIIDTGCSLKAFRRECLSSVKLFTGMHRFLPTLLKFEGYRIVQIPVNHRARRSGYSKYGVWNRALTAFVDLLAVRWMKKRRLNYEVASDKVE